MRVPDAHGVKRGPLLARHCQTKQQYNSRNQMAQTFRCKNNLNKQSMEISGSEEEVKDKCRKKKSSNVMSPTNRVPPPQLLSPKNISYANHAFDSNDEVPRDSSRDGLAGESLFDGCSEQKSRYFMGRSSGNKLLPPISQATGKMSKGAMRPGDHHMGSQATASAQSQASDLY